MKLLAIDTSAQTCAACVLDTQADRLLAEKSVEIGRGHAEVLMDYIEDCLSSANIGHEDLDRVGITIGPGSFTGVRVGMSVARGLGLSLNIPVAGVSTLDACEKRARELGVEGKIASLLDAKRGELYCKVSGHAPFAGSYEVILKAIREENLTLCGSGAAILNEAMHLKMPIIHSDASPKIATVAQLASQAKDPLSPPEPLYLRSADAKVQAGFALERA